MDDTERMNIIGDTLKDILLKYILLHLDDENIVMVLKDDKAIRNKVAKCITISIDVCIEIEALDYLLSMILPMFEAKNYGDLFFEKLEAFIMCKRLNSSDINPSTVYKIIDSYLRTKKLATLSQLLIRFKLEELKVDYLKELFEEYNLVTPMIYVYTIIENNVLLK